MRRLRDGLTYANVMSTLAVFLVLGGVGWAAAALPRDSVGTEQLKDGTITAAKVRSHSLLAKDFKPGQLKPGRRGKTGPAGADGLDGADGASGADGATGTALAYATVDADGTIVLSAGAKGLSNTDITHPATGVYCFSGPSGASTAMVAGESFSAATDDTVASVAVRTDGGPPPGCAATDTTRVHVFDLDGLQASETGAYHPALADRRFVIWFE